MSGIVGFWNPSGRPAAPEEIARMANAIARRGPDGLRTIVDGPVALGYLHFETRAKSLPILQPFVDAQAGLTIVLDGRIDNREQLEATMESRGLSSRVGSDAELILRAYELWDIESPARLLGDFAFAMWTRNRRFFCARDQIGVKPFVYHPTRKAPFSHSARTSTVSSLSIAFPND